MMMMKMAMRTSAAETTHPCSSFTFLLVSSTPCLWYYEQQRCLSGYCGRGTGNMRRMVTKIAKDKREQTSTKPDWRSLCWHPQQSPSCNLIPRHGRHSILIRIGLHDWFKDISSWCINMRQQKLFQPTQTSVASPQRNKSVTSSFCSSSFNIDSFWEEYERAFEHSNVSD